MVEALASGDPALGGSSPRLRIRVFVDFWNFSLELRSQSADFRPDWAKIGPLFALEAANVIGAGPNSTFEAAHVYGSFDPAKPPDAKLRNWATNTLDKMPGVHVTLLERHKKQSYPKCPKCQLEVKVCSSCGADMRGTEEKASIHALWPI